MGGCCCCAFKNTEHHRSPHFLHHPVSEEHEPLSSHQATASSLSPGLLVHTNLDTSVPDTYCSAPAPVAYERYTGHLPTSSDNQETSEKRTYDVLQTNKTGSHSTLEAKLQELVTDVKTKVDIELEASEIVEDEKSNELKKSSLPLFLEDDDDSCPTCFEEYDVENPKIVTKCNHHFHLGCILEWMERSDTCPVCDQKMVFSPVIGT